jgi:hypothetical protein
LADAMRVVNTNSRLIALLFATALTSCAPPLISQRTFTLIWSVPT